MSGQVRNNERPQEGNITKDDRTRILRELQGLKCFCGARKAMSQTFCRPHYSSLPPLMRSALDQRSGHGYEEAYTAAREYFTKAEVVR